MFSAREPGGLDGAWEALVVSGHPREGKGRAPGRQAVEESDALIVPKKSRRRG
jgi:hypothetical protein